MGRFEDTQKAVFSVFGSPAWVTEDIQTVPQDVALTSLGNEFVRVSVVASGLSVNSLSVSGVVIADIFTAAGKGPTRAMQIADALDRHLLDKLVPISPTRSVQFRQSTLSPRGTDGDNNTLSRSQYTVPFNMFGV